jgi:hypothetical protein
MSSDLATWAGVAVTTAAVIVALFQPRIFNWVWRPRVRIKGNVAYFPVRRAPRLYFPIPGAPSRIEGRGYARLKVEVGRYGPAAEDLRVYLLTCDPAAAVGGDADLPRGMFHLPLRWAFSHLESATLAPGVPSFVDLAELSTITSAVARLLTCPAPKEGYVLTRRTQPYTMHIAVAAKNMPAQRWRLRLIHLGEWNGDQDELCSRLRFVEDPHKLRRFARRRPTLPSGCS